MAENSGRAARLRNEAYRAAVSFNVRLQPPRRMISPAAVGCKPCWAVNSYDEFTPQEQVLNQLRLPEHDRAPGAQR